MANILNNNFQRLKLRVNHDEYWDLFLDLDMYGDYSFKEGSLYDSCLISYIDVSLYECVFENWINGLPNYTWEYLNVTPQTLYNIGYTGFDNGLISFRKDRILNKDFVKLYQDSTFKITNDGYSDDRVLKLHAVSGSTQVFEYPLSVLDEKIKLNGGFYQGFFKTDCEKYQILPDTLHDGETWAFEFVLKKHEHEKESDKTLNDRYPENKGLFFYLGTRAENKWVYLYNPNDDNDCDAIDIQDYVEGGEIDVKTYKIDAFLDMSTPPIPDEEEKTALDDYISYDYYKLVKKENGDIFDEDWGERENIIKEYEGTIDWCCDILTTTTKEVRSQWCGCGAVPTRIETTTHMSKGYFTKCEIFGDDYVADLDDMVCEIDYIENELDISDFTYETEDEFIIGKYETFLDSDNKFLLFDRTCDGYTVKNWEEGTYIRYVRERNTFNENLFLLMNHTCTGYNVNTISKLKEQYKEKYNIYKDLYNNALAFRITDDGEIGYRYLIKDCDSEETYSIKEGYSKKGIIKEDEWYTIHVKVEAYYHTMKLRFYVNGNLVFISSELPKLNLRKLDDLDEKQESVPFNISLGGGTQGLADVILPNYMIEPYRTYPLEKHFGGSFIGYFKSFKFYNCNLEYLNINNNFKYEMNKLK